MLGWNGCGRALLGCAVVIATLALTTPQSLADASATSLTSAPNPSTTGQSVTFKAVVVPVAGGAVAGTVIFKDGSTDISGGGVAVETVGLGFPLIAGGEGHTCALQAAGGAKCWGLGGLLGDGTYNSSDVPMSALLADAVAVSAGAGHTCALGSAGGVKCWGSSFAEGQLGDGTSAPSTSPIDVHGVGDVGLLSGISAISVGFYHSCAVTAAGGVRCWGNNPGGQVGDGTNVNRFTPVDVVGVGGVGLLSDIKAVSAGYNHTCALTNAGGVKCWGSNSSFGQLGDGTFVDSLVPVNVSGLTSGVVAIGAGAIHTCAVLSGGGVKCWGRGAEGQVGDNTFNSSNNVPLDVHGVGNVGLLGGISALDLGYYHTCALATDGGVFCWGYNGDGQIGVAPHTDRSTPVVASGLTNVSALAAGSYHNCAVTSAGAVKCWGRGNSGQLGNGGSDASDAPVEAAPLEALLFGEATLTTTALATGSRSITAEYSGDPNHAASTSDLLTQVVDPHTTSTQLVASVGPSVFGQPVTFTATVTSVGGTPTGTVTFSVNSVEQATVALSVGGTAEYETSSLAAGFAHGIVASYNGDPTHGTSSDFIPFHSVDKGATTTTVGAAPDPSTPGEQVTLTATVGVTSPAAGTPTGTVTFTIDDVDQTPVAVSGNQALLNTVDLSVGAHTITASYNGDASFNGSTSGEATQTVNLHPTSTTLVSSINPSVSGQSVTFTATVTGGGTPTGTVTFTISNVVQSPIALSSGSAQLAIGSLSVGAHPITAAYGGDATHAVSTSAEATQTANKGATSTSLAAAPTSSLPGAMVRLTATVAATAPAAGSQTGTVTFKAGATTIGTGSMSGGAASLNTAALVIGTNQLKAVYSGDANFAASTSAALPFSVDPRVGAEFRINTHGTTIAHLKQFPSVARLANNTFAVVWESKDQDGSGFGAYAQRHTAAGVKTAAEFRVNTFTGNAQQQGSIAGLTNGSVVVWASLSQDGSGWGIYGQRYTASGEKSGTEFRVNTVTANQQWQPSVAGLKAGGFLVTWASNLQDGSGYGVFAQRYTAAGAKAGVEFRVNTTTANNQWMPRVAPLENGGFVVIWSSNDQVQFGHDIYAQAYTSAGVKQGGQFRVNTLRAKDQTEPTVAGLKDGGIAMVWTSLDQDGSGLGVYGQRYNASLAKAGGEFRVNTAVGNNQFQPSVAAFTDRGFAVVWTSQNQDGSGKGVYARAYNAAGQAMQVEFRVNTTFQSDQWQPQVAAFSGGDFFAAWSSKNPTTAVPGIYGQRLRIGGL